MTRYRRSIFGTFFKCPMPECDGVCRNGTLVLLGHYVCEECFSRFAKVDEETVEIVETIQVDARIVGAVEVLATAGTIHMRQAYVNAAAASERVPPPFYKTVVERFRTNEEQYERAKNRSQAFVREKEKPHA